MGSMKMTEDEAISVFKTLADGGKSIPADDVFECIDSFRNKKPASKMGPPPTVKPVVPPTDSSVDKPGRLG
jgi:hypothetical protein